MRMVVAVRHEGTPDLAPPTDGELFDWAGVRLPPCRKPPTPLFSTQGTPVAGTGLRLYRNSELDHSPMCEPSPRELEPEQLVLDIRHDEVTLITSGAAAFMNATVRSAFRATRPLQRMAEYLALQDVLYLGDLARLTRHEFLVRLGPYRHLADDVESTMVASGLAIGAAAPWWRRPDDYYARAY